MNINELTYGELKEIAKIFGSSDKSDTGLNDQVGEKVIVRTYSAGAWFGKLTKKSGMQVYLENARRLWRFKCNSGISLSGVALHGVCHSASQICAPLKRQCLEAIEIIDCTESAIKSIEGAPESQPN